MAARRAREKWFVLSWGSYYDNDDGGDDGERYDNGKEADAHKHVDLVNELDKCALKNDNSADGDGRGMSEHEQQQQQQQQRKAAAAGSQQLNMLVPATSFHYIKVRAMLLSLCLWPSLPHCYIIRAKACWSVLVLTCFCL